MTTPRHPATGRWVSPGDGPPSRQAQAPCEVAAGGWSRAQAREAVGEMTSPTPGHAEAVLSGRESYPEGQRG